MPLQPITVPMRSPLICAKPSVAESIIGSNGLLLDFSDYSLGPNGFVSFSSESDNRIFFDSSGTSQNAAANTPRYDFSTSVPGRFSGILYEPASTNEYTNSAMTGASVETNTLPTSWAVNTPAGLTTTLVGRGRIGAFEYSDITIAGTTSGTNYELRFGSQTLTSAASGTLCVNSIWAAIIDGNTTNISSALLRVRENNGSGGFLTSSDVSMALTSVPTRFQIGRTFNNASTAFAAGLLRLTFSSGVQVNITLRLFGNMLEKGRLVASSFFQTTNAAAERKADLMQIRMPFALNRAIFTFDNDTTQTISGLTGLYSVPTNINRSWIKSILIQPQ